VPHGLIKAGAAFRDLIHIKLGEARLHAGIALRHGAQPGGKSGKILFASPDCLIWIKNRDAVILNMTFS
jgi:hypothetical protein